MVQAQNPKFIDLIMHLLIGIQSCFSLLTDITSKAIKSLRSKKGESRYSHPSCHYRITSRIFSMINHNRRATTFRSRKTMRFLFMVSAFVWLKSKLETFCNERLRDSNGIYLHKTENTHTVNLMLKRKGTNKEHCIALTNI